jgi:hypothetical protein
MANCYIKTEVVKRKKQFLVIEPESELVLKRLISYDEAKKFAKHVNKGGAFAGHTPPFMVRDLQKKPDIKGKPAKVR